MWAIKITKNGTIGKRRYAKGHYWADRHKNSVLDLVNALHYKEKDKAQWMIDFISRRKIKNPPQFEIVKILLAEVEDGT